MNGLQMKYFVLNPNKNDAYGVASRKALLAYAEAIEETNHDLFLDLTKWFVDIENKIAKEGGEG